MIKRICSQAKKELAQFSRDRLTVGLALILPLGMLLIYGYAIRLEIKNIPLSILFDLRLQTGLMLLLMGTTVYLATAVSFGLFIGMRSL